MVDVIKLQPEPSAKIFLKAVSNPSKQAPSSNGELLVPEHITVGELASLVKQRPFKVIADLMQLGFFATVNQSVGFEAVSKIARKYGYAAKRA